MLPTLADVLRVSDAPRNIDGLSWLPVIVGKVKEIRSDVLLRSISNKPTWALRTKQFKYLYEAETGGRELYDMRADPKEKKNILADKPDVAQKMHKRMEELVGTSLPITEPPK
jgi:arylsulfatase A-like enzyme